MVDIKQQPAIRTRVYIGGKTFTRDPFPPQITIKRLEDKKQVANGAMRVDRMFTADGFPNVRNRHEISLPWPTMPESALLEHLDLLDAIGQPFPLGLWKHVTDVFDGDGSSKTFFLQRRQLLPSVTPDTVFDDYPTRVIRYSSSFPFGTPTELTVTPKASADIDTGDPGADEAWVENEGHMNGALWCTTVRVGTAPVAAPDVLAAIYLPLYEVIIDSQAPRTYAQALVEPRSAKFSEFG